MQPSCLRGAGRNAKIPILTTSTNMTTDTESTAAKGVATPQAHRPPDDLTARVLAFGVVPGYRRYELRQARYLDMVAPAQEVLADCPAPRILDIGCGEGTAKRFLDHAGLAGHWTGVDLDAERVARCRALGYHEFVDDLDLEQSALPFADDSFDLVVASHIIEHLVNDTDALADWYRVLRPGGLMMLGLPMHLGLVAGLAARRHARRGRKPFGHCQFYSMASLRQLTAGYPVHDIRGFRILSGRKWLPLEDQAWFYRLSARLGRRYPGLTQEVNVEIRKPRRA